MGRGGVGTGVDGLLGVYLGTVPRQGKARQAANQPANATHLTSRLVAEKNGAGAA